jgi:hypothetical protein
MLTEGWDTNTVTHVLGVRAFSTQLLCEQVVGRALRRQNYTLNTDKTPPRFDVEYADILGIVISDNLFETCVQGIGAANFGTADQIYRCWRKGRSITTLLS